MKKALLLTILCFFIFIENKAQTQSYVPFPDSNAVWSADDGANHTYAILGDSSYNSHTYKKIYLTLNNQPFYYKGMIRQDVPNKKIFGIVRNTSSEKTLYDFNINVNDTVKVSPFYTGYAYSLKLISIDSIFIQTQYKKRYNFISIAMNSSPEFWIEGIGSSCGPFDPGCSGLQGADFCRPQLICFWQNNVLIYPSANFNFCYSPACLGGGIHEEKFSPYTLFPNPGKDFLTIEGGNILDISTIIVTNLLGQEELIVNKPQLNEKITLDLSTLSEGIHLLTIYTKEKFVFSHKIIKN